MPKGVKCKGKGDKKVCKVHETDMKKPAKASRAALKSLLVSGAKPAGNGAAAAGNGSSSNGGA